MSDDDITTPPEGEQDNALIKSLRKQIKDLTAERDGLKADARSRAFADAGVTEAGRKAMDRLYDGDLDGDTIRAFAAENGIQLASEESPSGGEQETPAEVAPEEQARRDAAQRVASVTANGTPPPPTDGASELKNQIAQAEKDGDVLGAIRLKSQQVDQMRRTAL